MVCSRGLNRRSLIVLPLLIAAAPQAQVVVASEPTPSGWSSVAVAEPLLNRSALFESPGVVTPGLQGESFDLPLSSGFKAPAFQFKTLHQPQYLAQVLPSALGTNTRVSTDAGGNRFEIGGGTQVEGNLFHRFEQLDLTVGQTASFLSNSTIEAIFSQVGGPASSIDGLLQVSGSGADLFLINPAGILLGPNARLDLSGSFTATTAARLGFGEQWIDLLGDGFNAEMAIADSLTALEFTGDGGAIANQGQLAVAPGETIGLLGHAVVNTGSLEAPGGQVTLTAARPGQQLSLNGGLLKVALGAGEASPLPLQADVLGGAFGEATGLQINPDGTIALAAGTALISGKIDVSAVGNGGGQVTLLGDALTLSESVVDASGEQGGEIHIGGDYQGQGDLLRADSAQVDAASVLRADAAGTGDGGRIVVWADDATQFSGTATASAQLGQGGLVETSGKQFLDVAGARVDASSLAGSPGEWLLDPTDIVIQAGGAGAPAAGNFDPVTTGPASIIAPATIETALDGGTNVTLTTASGAGGNGDLTLTDPINQTGGGNASLTLSGRRFSRNGGAEINLTSGGGLTFNLNQVNGEASPQTQSIQNAIDSIGAVTGPRLITLGPGLYTGAPAADLITIDTDLTLDGLDRLQTFISGSNNARVITVAPGTTAILKRLNVQDGQTAASGAGILNQGNLSLIDVLLQNNVAALDGGAIDSSAVGSSLTTETDTVILNNQAGLNGGGLALGGNSHIDGGGIFQNVAGNDGGGIYNTGTLKLGNLGVSQNDASRGGAIANIGSTASTTIQSFAVQDNEATLDGGGIFNQLGTINSLNGSFDDNIAGRNGGGLWSDGPTALQNTGFIDNQAALAGGGASVRDTTADLQSVTFEKNQAGGDGGGLRLSGTTAIISNSEFLSNQADFGGGLEVSNSGAVTLNGVTFVENVALRLGGALQNDDSVVLVANDPIFRDNRADLHGGAIHNSSTLTINDGFFQGNSSVLDGGAIRNFSGQITLNKGTFLNNVAARNGGAIYNADRLAVDGVTFEAGQAVAGGAIFSDIGKNVVTSSLFDGNVANQGVTTGDGGGIYSVQSDLFVADSTFRNNQAEDFGGAIASSEDNLTIANSDFSDNSARIGGGLHQNMGTSLITSSNFSKNQAQQQGGGLHLLGVSNSVIQETTIQGNQSTQSGGGGIALASATSLDLRQVLLEQNQAAGNGGAISGQFIDDFSGTLNVIDSTIDQNKSDASGGGIHLDALASGGVLNISNSTISNNQGVSAGAIHLGSNGIGVLQNVTISGNRSNQNGAGLSSNGTVVINHATIANNVADGDNTGDGQGGGIVAQGGTIRLSNTIVANNQAAMGVDVAGDFVDQGNNLIGISDGSSGLTISNFVGTAVAPINPLLAPLGNYGGLTQTMALLPGSKAIDAGSSAIPADQRGVAPVNATDIGAFESQGFVTASPGGTPQSTEVNTAFAEPLTVEIASTFGEPVDGGQVSFAAPIAGESITSTLNPTSVTITGGVAQLSVTANGVEGTYDVDATAAGVNPVAFTLTNTPAPTPVIPVPEPPVIEPPVLEPPVLESPVPTPSVPTPPTSVAPAPSVPVPPVPAPPLSAPVPSVTAPVPEPAVPKPAPETPELPQLPAFVDNPMALTTSANETPALSIGANAPLSLVNEAAVTAIDDAFSSQYGSYWEAAATEGAPIRSTNLKDLVANNDKGGSSAGATREILRKAEEAHGVKSAVVYALFVPQDKVADEGFGPVQVASMALARRMQTSESRDDDQLLLILVPHGESPVQRLVDVTRQELMQQVRLFRMAVSDPEDEWSYRPLAQQMQSWLFAPFEPELERLELDNLMYALAPGLRAIPLAAMMDGDEFVIERYGLSLIPSVDLLETNFGSSPPQPQTLAAGANEFELLNDLPAVEVELQAIANRRESVDVLFNQDFTLENLMATQNQSQAKMLHLATHAEFNAGDSGSSYLQFWDKRLTLDDISQLGWNELELLILSACQTAISSPEAELGFAGLAAATGVESTIGTLWAVSDVGTLGMMAEFYGQLNQESLRFEALRQAQLAMSSGETAIANQRLLTGRGDIELPQDWQLPEQADFSHPFYWAGFTLVGNPWW